MVLRDRNHPSIVIWGIGNEIPELEVDRAGALGKAARRPGARAGQYAPAHAGISRHHHQAHTLKQCSRSWTLLGTTTTYLPPTRRITSSCPSA